MVHTEEPIMIDRCLGTTERQNTMRVVLPWSRLAKKGVEPMVFGAITKKPSCFFDSLKEQET